MTYKPRAAEMNPDIPEWARKKIEGILEWQLEISGRHTCGVPKLRAGFYPGEVEWRPDGESSVDGAWIAGKGVVRAINLKLDDTVIRGRRHAASPVRTAQAPPPPFAGAYDPATGVTTASRMNADGTRTVTKTDRDGKVISRETFSPPGRGQASASAYDPQTGVTTTSRRARDGSHTVAQSRTWKDDKGVEHTQVMDNRGNQTEIVKQKDGSTLATQWDNNNNMTQTTHYADGSQKVISPTPDGYIEERITHTDGLTQVTKKDHAGNVLETTESTRDGRKVTTDDLGVTSVTTPASDGRYTVEKTDKRGNQTTTQYDRNGNVLNETENLAVPKAPGERYFENELGGRPGEWETLPESLKHQYANSENQIMENAAAELLRQRQVQDKIRSDEETARWEAEQNRITEEKLKQIAAEDEADKARWAEFHKREAFMAARLDAQSKLRDYDWQIYEALARGDKTEAKRLSDESDALAERSNDLFTPTAAEDNEIRRKQEVHDRLFDRVTSQARSVADSNLVAIEGEQELKETVTGKARYLSIGAEMQEQTKKTTRTADRELAFSQAKQAEIARMLSDPRTTPEERDMLHGMLNMADLQEYGSKQLLQSNAMLTAAGYGIDVAMTVSGGKLATTAARGVEVAAGRLLAEETAARVVTATTKTGVVTLAGQGVTRAGTVFTGRVAGDAAAQTVERALTTDVGAAARSAATGAATRVIGKEGVQAVTNVATKVGDIATMNVRDAASKVLGRESAGAAETAGTAEAVAEANATARPKPPSEMTPAERQAYAQAHGDADINGVLRDPTRELIDGGTGILSASPDAAVRPAVGELSKGLTQAEIDVLFRPGVNLTSEQLMQKTDLVLSGRVSPRYSPPPPLPPASGSSVAQASSEEVGTVLNPGRGAPPAVEETGTVLNPGRSAGEAANATTRMMNPQAAAASAEDLTATQLIPNPGGAAAEEAANATTRMFNPQAPASEEAANATTRIVNPTEHAFRSVETQATLGTESHVAAQGVDEAALRAQNLAREAELSKQVAQRAQDAERAIQKAAREGRELSAAEAASYHSDIVARQYNQQMNTLAQQAREAGVSEARIQQLTQAAFGAAPKRGATVAMQNLAEETARARGYTVLTSEQAEPILHAITNIRSGSAGAVEAEVLRHNIQEAAGRGADYFDELTCQGTSAMDNGFQEIADDEEIESLRQFARSHGLIR